MTLAQRVVCIEPQTISRNYGDNAVFPFYQEKEPLSLFRHEHAEGCFHLWHWRCVKPRTEPGSGCKPRTIPDPSSRRWEHFDMFHHGHDDVILFPGGSSLPGSCFPNLSGPILLPFLSLGFNSPAILITPRSSQRHFPEDRSRENIFVSV